jgi:molybdate transport system regulatory protein
VPQSLPREIDSLLAWRAGGRLLVGRERIALLEAVMQHKSITRAAEVTGFSYKTAWDAVNAINNLLPVRRSSRAPAVRMAAAPKLPTKGGD